MKNIKKVLILGLAFPTLTYASELKHCVSQGKADSVLANSLRMEYPAYFDAKNTREIELVSLQPTKIDIFMAGEVGAYGSLSKSKYSLKRAQDVTSLKNHVQGLIQLGIKQKEEKTLAKANKIEVSSPILEINGDIDAALNELVGLLSEYQLSSGKADCERGIYSQIAEITNAINNNYTEPVVSKIFIDDEFLMGWLSHINEPSRTSRKANIDTSAVDPQDSPLWVKKNIAAENTQIGFARKKMINVEGVIFKYDKPKTGFGTRPGIRIKQKVKGGSDIEYKVRIDVEAKTGPFLARLGNALGFSTYALDYVKEVEMEFTPKFFTEYHSRKSFGEDVYVQAQAESGNFQGLQPVMKNNRQREWNPFDAVISAKMKDGSEISAEELKAKLYFGEINKTDLSDSTKYNQEFASQIETFKIGPVSLEKMDDNEISIGSWGFNTLGHHDLREARGLTILAAWLSLHDLRKDNTRLMILKDEAGNRKLQMRLSDWGSGLGTANGHIIGFRSMQGELMADKIIEVDNINRTVNVLEFRPNQPSFASDLMSYDDAKWMVRKIGQLTEKQLDAALAMSGFSAPEFVMYKHKLIMRRNNLVTQFNLQGQYGVIATSTPANFASELTVQLLDGTSVVIPTNNDKIVGGKLILAKSIAASQDKKEASGALFQALGEEGLPRLLRKLLLNTPDDKIPEIALLAELMNEKKPGMEEQKLDPAAKVQELTKMVTLIVNVIHQEPSLAQKAELTRKTGLLLKSMGQKQSRMILENVKKQLPSEFLFFKNPVVLVIDALLFTL